MIIPLNYAGGTYPLEIPERNLQGLLETERLAPLNFQRVLEQNKLPKAFDQGRFRLLIIINDSFRMTPSPLILDEILPQLWDSHEIRIIIATGLHPEPAEAEKPTLIGRHYDRFRDQIFWSDSDDLHSFRLIGKWPDGGEIYLHNLFYWAEKVIVIGSVEPHYFAGFTGGIKSLIPGISYKKTIAHNHQKAINPGSQPAAMEGNPVWESLWETVKYWDNEKVFSFQMVRDSARQVVGLFSGHLRDSYDKAVQLCKSIYIKVLTDRCDLLVAEHSPPLDRNLYQLQKCFENTQDGVANGGALIMLSGCREGIGTRSFYDLAGQYQTPEKVLESGRTDFNLGIHKLYRTALLTKRINLFLMSFLPKEVVSRVYIEPVEDVNWKLNEILHRNPDLRILVVRDAGHTVVRMAG